MEITTIGLGGVGSILSERISRFLNYSNSDEVKINLVDGDEFEHKNLERQEFIRFGNKAQIKTEELSNKFRKLNFSYYDQFVNEHNINQVIKEKSVTFLCVDNHKTRKLVSDYCKTLNDITLISGGNEYTDGNVQIYVRKEGHDLTPDLCTYHREIENPEDKSPEEMSCEELSMSLPQLYFTNLSVATIMCWAFYNVVIQNNINNCEVYFDILKMSVDAKKRTVKGEIK